MTEVALNLTLLYIKYIKCQKCWYNGLYDADVQIGKYKRDINHWIVLYTLS